jgi:hypothetical protein
VSLVKLVHIHTFKCAGTTFAASLASNFKDEFSCIEPKTRQFLDWDQIKQTMAKSKWRAISSHSLRIPDSQTKGYMFMALVRNPSERLISAWRFQTNVQKISNGSFSSYLKNQSGAKNVQSLFLYNSEIFDGLDIIEIGNESFDLFRHRPNVFLGVVERYDESMTVLEKLLGLNLLNVDLSYPRILNKNVESQIQTVPDVTVPDDYIRKDEALYKAANFYLDLQISLIPNFKDLLSDFRARCKLHRLNPHDFNSKISNENWYLIEN